MAIFQKPKTFIVPTLIVLTTVILAAESGPNTSVYLTRCNVKAYSQADPYANSVSYVLADLMNVTPNHGYDYSTQSPYAAAVSYGHATCNLALSYSDCADCLVAARAAVESGCPSKIGGTVEMVDCTIRYENYAF